MMQLIKNRRFIIYLAVDTMKEFVFTFKDHLCKKKRKLYTLKTPRLPEHKVSLFLFGHAVFCPAGADWRVIGWLRYILAQCAN